MESSGFATHAQAQAWFNRAGGRARRTMWPFLTAITTGSVASLEEERQRLNRRHALLEQERDRLNRRNLKLPSVAEVCGFCGFYGCHRLTAACTCE